MRTFHTLCLLFVLLYTQGAVRQLGLPDVATKFLVELAILFLLSSVVMQFRWKAAPGLIFVVLFVIWTVFSGIVSGDGLYLSLLYFRTLAFAYLVFWAVWNADLTAREILRLNWLILWLWILQIAAALFELFILGERIEGHVGVFESVSGAPAVAFPLFAMAYVMGFYCYYKRSAWVVLLALSFGVIGYASCKRAIYFLMPAFYVLIILWYCFREKSFASIGQMVKPLVAFALFVPLILFGIANTHWISSGREDAGAFESIAFAIERAKAYTFKEGEGGATTGRTGSSLKVLRNLPGRAFGDYLFGLGPASMTITGGKWARGKENIRYGVVGWTRDTISVGWPAMLFRVGFFALLWWKLYRRRSAMSNGYAKALHFGCHLGFAAYFLMYFFYGGGMSGWFTFVHLYFVALILSPKHQSVLGLATKRKRVLLPLDLSAKR